MKDFVLRKKSVVTDSENLELLYSFKNFPVFFGCVDEPQDNDITFDMDWYIDLLSGVIQLKNLIPIELLYQSQHVDCTGKTWQDYNQDFASYILSKQCGDIIEIGGGSGSLAKIVTENRPDNKYVVVEPNPLISSSDSIDVVKSFFSKKLYRSGHTVVFSQVLEHIYDPQHFLNEIYDSISADEKVIFAYPNLELWFSNFYSNAINFEHTMLLTDYFLDFMLERTGFKILDKTEYKNHSHFYFLSKSEPNKKVQLENKFNYYKDLFYKYINYNQNLIKEINSFLEKTHSDVFLFGGHIFSQYLISFGLNISKVKFILDNSKLKQGKRLYGTNLFVRSPSILSEYKNPVVILKASIYNDEIKKDILENINNSTIFI
jgi:hypothetical protein